jgi:glycosyltransferase involved in cell wall biosynthesis
MGEMNPLLGWGHRVFEGMIPRLGFTRFIADSDFTRKRLLTESKVNPQVVTTIYPAIDYEFWTGDRHVRRDLKGELGLSSECFVYLFFGRPGVSKGVEYLIRAAAIVRDELPESRLILLLSHHPKEQYRNRVTQIRRLGLESYITVLQPVDGADLPGVLLGADLIVVPSLSEGFGYAALEAATLGRPVVATTGHSVEEIVGDVVTLVPPRDERALAVAIIREAHERRTPATPSRFTTDDHVNKTIAVYEDALT